VKPRRGKHGKAPRSVDNLTLLHSHSLNPRRPKEDAMLALTAADIRSLVSMPDAIALMKEAFRDLATGAASAPLRTPIEVPAHHAVSLFMPAAVPSVGGLGLKVVSVFPDNPARGLPTIHALVCLIDPEDGTPLAIMDGTYLTALRTGAVSGAATDLLARQGAHVLALFGTGAQAITQAQAICAVRVIDEIRVVARSAEKGAAFIARMRAEDPETAGKMRLAANAAEALRGAQVICTATAAMAALFADTDVEAGTHINAVGAYTPAMQEIPAEMVARSLIVVDQRAAAWAEAGDLVIARDRGLITADTIHAELGELVAGVKPGRQSPDQVTFFKSVGNAVQDIAVGRRAVDRAMAQGMGQAVHLA
jgi:alanine dehydrogenase